MLSSVLKSLIVSSSDSGRMAAELSTQSASSFCSTANAGLGGCKGEISRIRGINRILDHSCQSGDLPDIYNASANHQPESVSLAIPVSAATS